MSLAQSDADAAAVLRAAEYLRMRAPELALELRAISRRLIGRVDAPQPSRPRRVHTERVMMNGRVVAIVQQKRAQFGI